MAAQGWEVIDSRTVRAEDGSEHDVIQAIGQLPWVDQLCPLMPHQYAVLFKSSDLAWRVLDALVRSNPDSYRAYFRGYPRPNLYWEAPDGLRYWRTGMMLNRCTPDSVEQPRRVDQGAKPMQDWDGPPWAPRGSALGAARRRRESSQGLRRALHVGHSGFTTACVMSYGRLR